MNVIYSVKDYVTNVFDFNQATASGAIDIVAVQQEDGSYRCTPFHVHFGKIELKKNAEKMVTMYVNGKFVDGVHMKLGAAGEAFFVDAAKAPVDDDYSTSPLVSPSNSLPRPIVQSSSISTAEHPPTSGRSPEQAKWHDAYRLVSDARPPTLRRETSAPADRLTWGWGALPIVRAVSMADLSNVTEESQTDDEQPKMVKNASVYFDAVEPEPVHVNSYVSDHPCMSLCGHLLDDARTQDEAHAIFSEHIITSDLFKENACDFLQNPHLRFLVDGQIYPFDAEFQAYLVSRVLFPSSAPLPLTSAWKTTTLLHQRRPSEQNESSFWFGDLFDDEEEEEGGGGGEEGPQENPVERDDDDDDSDELGPRRRRWFQWFPRSSSAEGLLAEGSSFQPVDHHHAGLRSVATANMQPEFYRKTLQPSQEQLQQMGLRHGTNDVEFVVHTAKGIDRVCAKLYLWPASAKIIIAEIDGAISRMPSGRRLSSLLPIMERDVAGPHQGALDFYARAARNGYRIVYLTSHGLSQADLLHDMLKGSSSLGKGEQQSLPKGPVLLSPDRLLEINPDDTTVTRDFKVAALNGIRMLFPEDVNPFYAAFGKTYADSVVFTEAGVFPGKVFLVDQGDGRLRHRSMMNYKESYCSLLAMVDKMFPPICSPSPRHPTRRNSNSIGSPALTWSSTGSFSSSPPDNSTSMISTATSPLNPMKRVPTATEELVSDVISSHVRTRSMGDEAYNDVNYWRIKPGSI